MTRFVATSGIDASADEVFAWHARPGALARLIPPWERVRIESEIGTIADARVVLRMRGTFGSVRWVAQHRDAVPGRLFRDEQVEGPFARWTHTHRFDPEPGGAGSTLVDEIEHALPFGRLGRALAGGLVARRLGRTFRFRHRRTREDLARHARHAGRPRLRVGVSGASGMIGSALCAFLTTGGHEAIPFLRPAGGARSAAGIRWDPSAGTIDRDALEGLDAVVHLAGENVGARRWTPARKAALLESRVATTRLLVEALRGLARPPRTLVCASAIGAYGDRGDEVVSTRSPLGRGFLADLVRAWEAEAAPATDRGIRVVLGRLAPVLSARGGALARMLPAFRRGAGGPIGSGRQWVSWIALDDAVGALGDALLDERWRGAIDVAAPAPVRQRELARCLGAVLRRPTLAPLPAVAARAILGERADALLLASVRVDPVGLRALGYAWTQGDLEDCLRFELGRT